MSQISDIRHTLSQDWIKKKLTLDERAQILCEIVEDLSWDKYTKYDDDGNYIGHNLELAKHDLNWIDQKGKGAD